MKIRILTDNNFIDVEVKDVTEAMLIEALEEGSTVAFTKQDGNIFIINSINVVAIEILKEVYPPIQK